MQGNAMQGNMTHLTRELAVLWDELFEAVASITSAAAKIDVLATGLQGASAEGIHAQTANIVKACDFRNATAERIAKIAGELVRVDQFGRGVDYILRDNSVEIAGDRLDVQHSPVGTSAQPLKSAEVK